MSANIPSSRRNCTDEIFPGMFIHKLQHAMQVCGNDNAIEQVEGAQRTVIWSISAGFVRKKQSLCENFLQVSRENILSTLVFQKLCSIYIHAFFPKVHSTRNDFVDCEIYPREFGDIHAIVSTLEQKS